MPQPVRRPALLESDLTSQIIGAMYETHSELGFGYREVIYAMALEQVLMAKGHRVAREVSVMVCFRGRPLTTQVLDMVVDEKVIVEIKATERLHPAATSTPRHPREPVQASHTRHPLVPARSVGSRITRYDSSLRERFV